VERPADSPPLGARSDAPAAARWVAVAAPGWVEPPTGVVTAAVETDCRWRTTVILFVAGAAAGRMLVENQNRGAPTARCRYRPAVDWLSSPPCSRIHARTIPMADNSLNRTETRERASLQISHGLPMAFWSAHGL
jgi:hypothetical protein